MLVTSTPDFWRLFVPDTAKARMPQRLTSHFAAVALLATIAVPSRAVVAADLDDARALLRAGKYEEAETFAAEALSPRVGADYQSPVTTNELMHLIGSAGLLGSTVAKEDGGACLTSAPVGLIEGFA